MTSLVIEKGIFEKGIFEKLTEVVSSRCCRDEYDGNEEIGDHVEYLGEGHGLP